MPKNKKEDEETIIHITITLEDDEEECDYQPSALDVAAYNFTKTLNYYVTGFILLFIIGSIASLFS